MKKFIFLAGIIILAVIVFVLKPTKNNDTETPKNIETLNDAEVTDNTVYTVTLQHTEPARVGDEYSWMLVSEPGQLGYSLNALGLSNQDPVAINEQLGKDETTVVYQQDDIDLEQICNKLGLDKDTLLADLANNKSITITYSYDDVTIPVQ
ncbi:MAG: hypothetical protein GX947_05385 [Tissierellia bacterium]|nr:hypothetical protein [Tissierellia bacterium]